MNRIIGLDPGSKETGMVILENSNIIGAFNLKNEQLYIKITNYLLHNNITVVIEDLAAYSLRLTPQVISVAKFIGELIYRLKNEAGCNVILVPRSEVKKWCYNTFESVCVPMIQKKVEKRGYKNENGEFRKGNFFFIDDKIVTECMKFLYNIPLPPSGKGYVFGLKTHSWQALAVASTYLYSRTRD